MATKISRRTLEQRLEDERRLVSGLSNKIIDNLKKLNGAVRANLQKNQIEIYSSNHDAYVGEYKRTVLKYEDEITKVIQTNERLIAAKSSIFQREFDQWNIFIARLLERTKESGLVDDDIAMINDEIEQTHGFTFVLQQLKEHAHTNELYLLDTQGRATIGQSIKLRNSDKFEPQVLDPDTSKAVIEGIPLSPELIRDSVRVSERLAQQTPPRPTVAQSAKPPEPIPQFAPDQPVSEIKTVRPDLSQSWLLQQDTQEQPEVHRQSALLQLPPRAQSVFLQETPPRTLSLAGQGSVRDSVASSFLAYHESPEHQAVINRAIEENRKLKEQQRKDREELAKKERQIEALSRKTQSLQTQLRQKDEENDATFQEAVDTLSSQSTQHDAEKRELESHVMRLSTQLSTLQQENKSLREEYARRLSEGTPVKELRPSMEIIEAKDDEIKSLRQSILYQEHRLTEAKRQAEDAERARKTEAEARRTEVATLSSQAEEAKRQAEEAERARRTEAIRLSAKVEDAERARRTEADARRTEAHRFSTQLVTLEDELRKLNDELHNKERTTANLTDVQLRENQQLREAIHAREAEIKHLKQNMDSLEEEKRLAEIKEHATSKNLKEALKQIEDMRVRYKQDSHMSGLERQQLLDKINDQEREVTQLASEAFQNSQSYELTRTELEKLFQDYKKMEDESNVTIKTLREQLSEKNAKLEQSTKRKVSQKNQETQATLNTEILELQLRIKQLESVKETSHKMAKLTEDITPKRVDVKPSRPLPAEGLATAPPAPPATADRQLFDESDENIIYDNNIGMSGNQLDVTTMGYSRHEEYTDALNHVWKKTTAIDAYESAIKEEFGSKNINKSFWDSGKRDFSKSAFFANDATRITQAMNKWFDGSKLHFKSKTNIDKLGHIQDKLSHVLNRRGIIQ